MYSTWASSTFDALLLISWNGFGSTNFSAAFRRRNCLLFSFFLVFFVLFFICQFLSYYLDVFFASLPSLTHSFPHSLLQTRGNDHLFCFIPFVRLSRVLGLRKSKGCFVVCIQLERRALLMLCYWSAGTDLVVLTFQLLLDTVTVFFFLSFLFSLFYFLFVSFYRII